MPVGMSVTASTAASDLVNRSLTRALLAQDLAAVRAQLARATLLVPVSPLGERDGLVRQGRTAGGAPLFWAFSDEEALYAWDRRPARAAAALDAPALARLNEADTAVVAINPAGPGGLLVEATVLSDRSGARAQVAGPGLPHVFEAPDARAPARARAREALGRGRAALAAGDAEAAAVELRRSIAACVELGDRLHEAETAVELAGCLAAARQVEEALATWRAAAQALGLFGELDLAATALIEAAEAACRAGRLADAEQLSVDALECATGREFSDRLTDVWSRLRD